MNGVCGIYKIEYLDRCAYVGSSVNVGRRIGQHIVALKNGVHKNPILQRMWNKHASDFKFALLEAVAHRDGLIEAEQRHIDGCSPLANISDARGSHPHTDEAKERMRGRIVSSETRLKLSVAHKGKPSPNKGTKVSDATREKLSLAHMGQEPWNRGSKGKMVAWNKGLNLSPEHRLKLSEAKKGRPRPDISAALLGRKLSEEHKRNIAAGWAARSTNAAG